MRQEEQGLSMPSQGEQATYTLKNVIEGRKVLSMFPGIPVAEFIREFGVAGKLLAIGAEGVVYRLNQCAIVRGGWGGSSFREMGVGQAEGCCVRDADLVGGRLYTSFDPGKVRDRQASLLAKDFKSLAVAEAGRT
jgi:hypothetical protein